ncbi:MAG: ABC transporter ATP-binding protein [Gemmatimonadetes bacterium]|jgi:ABC-2 type transport system ATP-binding protein|nr:ABC transporter ATP-binding protein [Gemmatimonadota bacterium]MBT5801246.1 ABC transporter ATP-binding protein [Gemmatimonadota bacterium]MBT6961132.1 ABC transporter ATP-binding protein [Rhodospirillaceae bacterium]MBT7549198.1 ABC transporter ATP-binding protein [Gemmatimonadota bacterium]
MDIALTVNGLEKRYKGFQLGPLDLELPSGTVTGLIGANGAGKTTALHCMAGLEPKDGGSGALFGQDIDYGAGAWKHEVALAGDQPFFYESWTGQKNLDFIASFFPKWSPSRATELATRFRCPLDKKVKTLSKGNRVTLGLIAALAREPRVLLLDEPTAGLDPLVRSETLNALWELIESGEHTIFYSTHNLSDIGRLADQLIFLNEGHQVLQATVSELDAQWGKISYRAATALVLGGEVVSQRSEGQQHQLVTSQRETTLNCLQSAEDVQCSALPIEEIAVLILKQVR